MEFNIKLKKLSLFMVTLSLSLPLWATPIQPEDVLSVECSNGRQDQGRSYKVSGPLSRTMAKTTLELNQLVHGVEGSHVFDTQKLSGSAQFIPTTHPQFKDAAYFSFDRDSSNSLGFFFSASIEGLKKDQATGNLFSETFMGLAEFQSHGGVSETVYCTVIVKP